MWEFRLTSPGRMQGWRGVTWEGVGAGQRDRGRGPGGRREGSYLHRPPYSAEAPPVRCAGVPSALRSLSSLSLAEVTMFLPPCHLGISTSSESSPHPVLLSPSAGWLLQAPSP